MIQWLTQSADITEKISLDFVIKFLPLNRRLSDWCYLPCALLVRSCIVESNILDMCNCKRRHFEKHFLMNGRHILLLFCAFVIALNRVEGGIHMTSLIDH